MLCWFICCALSAALLFSWFRLHLLHRDMDDLCADLAAILAQDTNRLLSCPSRDAAMRRLTEGLNLQLKRLRKHRHRYLNGERALRGSLTDLSHDLRTPLTALCGYVELMKEEPLSRDGQRYLALIEERAEALKQLMEELFSYTLAASGEELRLETVDLNRIIEKSAASFYAAFKARKIEPVICLPDQPVLRRLDPAALSRILDNLLGNALKYSAGDLHITLSQKGEICFANTAPTLDKVQAGRLFDRFFSVSAARSSTGLGLSIAKELTEQMNGSITAEYREQKLFIRLLFPELPL